METGEEIRYCNRYTGRVETEAVFGETFLRWTYETGVGRGVLELAVKRQLFSRMYGWWMSRARSRRAIRPFIERYGLDVTEFAEPVEAYSSFNDFFARRLRDGVRPVAEGEDVAVFPADGRHLGFSDTSAVDAIYAKGQRWDLRTLLGSDPLAEEFGGGSAIISRLCPVDYHCYHFPVGGTVVERGTPVGGALYSVSPIALRRRIDYLWRNKCARTIVENERFGRVAIVEIGATCVGSIVQADYGKVVAKGELKGWFLFGGSCVITLFLPGRARLDDDLLDCTRRGTELYARCGDRVATAG